MIGLHLSANDQSFKLMNHEIINEASVIEMEIAEVLIDGVWTKRSVDTEKTTTLQFNDAGLVGILSTVTEGNAEFAHKHWHLEGFTDHVYLILTDLVKDDSETFLVNQIPTGIALTNIYSGELINLNHACANEVAELRKIQQSLSGEWRSSIHYLSDNKETRKVTFHYDLQADGSLECIVERFGHPVRSEKGYWQVSPSGAYIVFHIADQPDTFTTQLAKIKYLAFDELVIDTFCTDTDLAEEMKDKVKTLFFNKI